MAGILLPKNAKGERSTTSFGKAVFCEMAKSLGDTDLADSIASETDWRHKYDNLLTRLVERQVVSATENPAAALESLRVGLAKARSMDFEKDGTSVALSEAVLSASPTFDSAVVSGSGVPRTYVSVPYKGEILSGETLDAQLDRWAEYGTMEPDCAAAIQGHAARLGDAMGRTFVVLGAGSELGPLRHLLQAGARVIGVATRKPKQWAELISFARTTAGTLVVPVPKGTVGADDQKIANLAGVDLISEVPIVVEWIMRCLSEDPESLGPITVGTYLYADGELNLRISAAADFVIEAASKLGKQRVSFAWMGSPSTSVLIPQSAVEAQKTNEMEATSWWQRLLGYESSARQPLSTGDTVYHGFLVLQGPSYALAQLMRQWRAMLLNSEGFVVSTPMTPVCRTDSVIGKSSSLARFLNGVAYFAPNEAFEGSTAQALMVPLMLSDITSPVPDLPTPFHLMSRKAFHSGCWRCPYTQSGISTSSFILGTVMPLKAP